MEEIRVLNPKNLNIIEIKANDFIEFVCYDKEGYKVSYDYLKGCYIKELY